MALPALALVLAVSVASPARAVVGHGFEGGHPGGAELHHGFDGHHGFDQRGHGRFLFGYGPGYPYYGYYPSAPTYWYYCPSYGAYYPDVDSCPEAWVPVPAS